MSQFTTIQEFNTYLSDKLRNVKLNEYFNLIQSQFYSDLDISFMDYFLELCNHENEFIVEHIKLQEYGVLTNVDTSKDIKRRLSSLFLIENEDYLLGNVAQSRLENQHGGSNGNKKEYKLTPYAFKLCLIRSKNSKEYAKYYLLLEQVFKNYQEYQIMYQQILLSGKDKKLDEMKATIDKQSSQIDELLNYGKQTTEKLNEIHEQNEDLKEQNDDLKDTMDDIKEQNEDLKESMDDIKDAFKDTADRSVPKPNEEHDRHEFILLQHKELTNRFKFIRGIQKYNESKIASKYSEYNIIKRDFNANPIQLFKQFKESIKENYKLEKAKITANKTLKNKNQLKKEVEKIKFTGNDLELQFDYTLDNLLDKLSEVCNERFTEYNNSCDEE
jgi:uncharacterized protein YoxC